MAMRGGQYAGYLRLDIKNFYPSVLHDRLLEVVADRIHEPPIIQLVERCIKQRSYRTIPEKNTEGIPQGLPVSNVLANIYLSHLDAEWSAVDSLLYARFVDDILILGDLEKLKTVFYERLASQLEGLGLQTHPLGAGKSDLQPIDTPVTYLGYRLTRTGASVRETTVAKLHQSLIGIIVSHARKKRSGYRRKLLWRLNLRVTGCIVNRRRYGWLFFFSEIDDMALLKSLDVFLAKMLKRWRIRGLRCKKFIRAFFEVRYRAESSKYIPSFDLFEMADKVALLRQIYGVKITEGDPKS